MLTPDGTIIIEPEDDKSITSFARIRSGNSCIKLMIAIGGSNVISSFFSTTAATIESRLNFARSVDNILNKYNLDGVDISWQYPAQNGGIRADKENFPELLAELKKMLSSSNRILSISVGASPTHMIKSYNVQKIVPNVDFINLLTFDFATSSMNKSGLNAPLYALNNSSSVDLFVKTWIKKKIPTTLLNLGIAAYGVTFTLSDPCNITVGAPILGDGLAGYFTRRAKPGFIGYNEICLNRWPRIWSKISQVPYAVKGDQFVSYDDTESIKLKSNYIISSKLGGAMIWMIDTDDFRGNCIDSMGQYPLLSTIYSILMDT